jgi:hypothetical protein
LPANSGLFRSKNLSSPRMWKKCLSR